MSNKTILITGANGFIGGYLSRFLQNKGFKVSHYDRNNPPDKIVDDVVIHCAAKSTIRDNDIAGIWKANVNFTQEVFYRIPSCLATHFINLSSIAVYGTYINPPSELDWLKPNTVYGMSKVAAEMIFKQYPHKSKITSLRLGGICGPEMTHGILKKIIQHYKDGRKYIDFYKPEPGNKMTYIHVEYLAEIILKMIKKPPKYNIYNITSSNAFTIPELIQWFNWKLQKGLKITWLDDPSIINDPSTFIGETRRLYTEFGPVPRIEEGLTQLIQEVF